MTIWKPVEGYSGDYEVSDAGEVRSFKYKQSRILSPGLSPLGYKTVWLRHKGKRARGYQVHRLVLEAFVGACPEGYECGHRDGNPSNNNLSNLRWVTPTENHADKNIHGTQLVGEKNHNAKLTKKDVLEIRSLKGIKSQSYIASMFSVSATVIGHIHNRKTWKHF